MSRSYKKHPGWTGRSGESWKDKRLANHKVRKISDLPDGSAFRRVSETWDIRDYNFRYYTRQEAIDKLTKYYGKRVYHSWMK